jgi:hypothetical protein
MLWGGSVKHRGQKARFWTILTVINIVAMLYPVTLYVQADNSDAQFFAAVVLLGTAFLLAITDTVSALVAYL